jgi:hypothetical protein
MCDGMEEKGKEGKIDLSSLSRVSRMCVFWEESESEG